MRICILVTSLKRGGAEKMASCLANEFSKRGDEVSVIKFDMSESAFDINKNVRCESLKCVGNRKIVRVINRIKKTNELIRSINPDILLCFSPKTAIYPLLSIKKKKYKLIVTERSNPYYEHKKSPFIGRIIKYVENHFILPRADGFVFLTKEAKGYYNKKIQENSVVIPNGLFSDTIERPVVPFEQREKTKICAVGNLRKVKDYETMIKGFSMFVASYPDYKLYILGDGDERERLESLCKDLNLTENVFFLGSVDNPVSFIANAYVFVHTSQSESWGNSILEALALGIPCVCTDCDFGPRNMISDNTNGILVPVADSKGVCNGISRIVEDKEFAKKISFEAMKVRQNFSSDRIINMYLEYFNFLISK